jgi:hypothetical protein
MNAKHTHGPWNIEYGTAQQGDGNWIVDSDDNGTLSRLAMVAFHDEGEGETYANTHLIAAAPDLLAACAELELYISANYGLDGENVSDEVGKDSPSGAVARARAAIARATGKEQR